jgi:hypothetical protein
MDIKTASKSRFLQHTLPFKIHCKGWKVVSPGLVEAAFC